MVSVSVETIEQTERRLRSVIASAELHVLPGEWAFHEAPLDQPPRLGSEVLAAVRDEDTWCWLSAADPRPEERFALFSFHFPANVDNSGFVGWLATVLKRELGTGVFVVCGQNRNRGGVYDYWGCPRGSRTAGGHGDRSAPTPELTTYSGAVASHGTRPSHVTHRRPFAPGRSIAAVASPA